MANFYTFMSDGRMTLSMICSTVGCNKSELITMNSQKYSEGMTVGQYLQSLDLSGDLVPKGLTFKIPVSLTGGVNTRYSSPKSLTSLLTTVDSTDTKYNVNTSNSHDLLRSRAANTTVGKDFNCSVYVLLNGANQGVWSIPVYPNEFSDNNGSNFNAQNLLGRSVDYQIYQGSSRDVSFTLQMHEELCSSYNYIHSLVAYIESACYPGYSGNIVEVPEICFNIGSQFKIRGILTNCSANWKAPIINGKLVNCDLSVSVRETTGPFSQGQVASSGGWRS